MKRLLLLLFAFPFYASAQDAPGYNYDKNTRVAASSDPAYPAGEMALYEYVFNKLEYGKEAIAAKVKAESMINFDVNPDSTLSGFSVVTEAGYGIDQSIISILKELKFAPGTINGKPAKKNMVLSFPVEVE